MPAEVPGPQQTPVVSIDFIINGFCFQYNYETIMLLLLLFGFVAVGFFVFSLFLFKMKYLSVHVLLNYS